MPEKVIGVIPARYASSRLPGKPLINIAGKSLVQWVWEAAQRCTTLDDQLVATDDVRIARECERIGARVAMTSPLCPSGSDRIAEAVAALPHQVIVNIQGDEPLIDPETIDACVTALAEDPNAGVASAMTVFRPHENYLEPHMVKVVTDSHGYAMYFSRAAIPDIRRLSEKEKTQAPAAMKHVGLYVYRRSVLENYVQLPASKYEKLEKLEQLRLLETGIRIRMVEVPAAAIGVDTPEDIVRVEQLLKNSR